MMENNTVLFVLAALTLLGENLWATPISEVEVPVNFYCQEQEAAAKYLSHFVIVEGPKGVFVHLGKEIPPHLPKNLSQLLLLKRQFKVLSENEQNALAPDDLKQYLSTQKQIVQLDQFLDYQANKKCFWHDTKRGFKFSLAKNLKWSSEHKIVENDGTEDFKIDIYEAELDFFSYMQKGFIYSSPCRIVFDQHGQMNKCDSF